eukprot:s2652_g2.t1
MEPIIVDAADAGLIHRKRLWWKTISWEAVEERISDCTPWSFQWHIDRGILFTKLLASRRQIVSLLDDTGTAVDGRSMPSTINGYHVTPETLHRWNADQRRYPPWQYEDQFLVQWPDGSHSTAPADLREQLQGLRPGFTTDLSDGQTHPREVALGNAWHLPTAMWILFLLLLGSVQADAVIQDIRDLVDDMQEETTAWFALHSIIDLTECRRSILFMLT